MISKLPISNIRKLPEMQPRATMNQHVIDDYAEDIRSGAKFPPLDVFNVNGEFILVDGFHRLLAAQEAGLKKLYCEVRTGTIRDAFLFASGANSTHGFRRTNEDKRKAVERLLTDPEWKGWSDNKIAEICKVSVPFVGKMRGITINVNSENPREPAPNSPQSESVQPETRTYETKHGTIARMNIENIGKKPEFVPATQINNKPEQTAPTPSVKQIADKDEFAKNLLNNLSSQYFLMVNDLMRAKPEKYPTITDVLCSAITLLSEQEL